MLTKFKKLLLSAGVVAAAMAGATTNTAAQNWVVGGTPINIIQAPATVSLLNRSRVETNGNFAAGHFCGGTVIAPRWVLTAAHCVLESNGRVKAPSEILVLIGTTDLAQPTTQPINVTQVIAHEEYSSANAWRRDIALVGLEFDATPAPVALDGMTQALNDRVYLAGWGATVEGNATTPSQIPTQLQGVALRLVPGDECGIIFPSFAGSVDGTHVCAAVNGGGRGSCFGDSGGPLYRITPDSRVGSLIGIVSGGRVCGETGVYTSAISYADWIRSKIGNVGIAMDGGTTGAAASADSDSGTGSWILPLMVLTLLIRRRMNA